MSNLHPILLSVLFVAAPLAADARECSVTLDVDNPTALAATFDGAPLTLNAGPNTITYEGDGYNMSSKIEINSTGPDIIIENVVCRTEGFNARAVQRGVKWESWFYEENDGCEYVLTTKDMAPLRTASCTITVLDDGGGISASRGDHAFGLTTGTQTVRFDPSSETDFVFTLSSWVSCHTFTVNGEPVDKTFYEYEVTLADGDEVVIAVYDPVNTVPVHIEVNPEGADAIRNVEVNHLTIDEWTDFTVKAGEKIGVNYNTDDFHVKSITVNGEPQSIGYTSVVAESEPINISVIAAPWGNMTITVNATIPEAVKMYYIEYTVDEYGLPDIIEHERFALVKGENAIQIPERGARLVIVPRYGYATDITDAQGAPLAIEDNCVTAPSDGMVINLDSHALEYDGRFAIFVDGTYGKNEISVPGQTPTVDFDFGCYAHAWSEDWADIEQSGYTFIPIISQHDIAWRLAVEGCHVGRMDVFVNDSSVADEVEHDTWGDWYQAFFKPADGDIFRFYPKGPAARYSLDFDISADAAGVEILADHMNAIADFTTPYRGFASQEFTVRRAGENVVRLGDTELIPDADGNYSFTLASDATLSIVRGAGVSGVSADSPRAAAVVYNLQGIRMDRPLSDLPAGVYIVNGKKVIR